MNILCGLNLTPFEWTMSNEVAGSLMEFVVRLCCTGPVDVDLFNQAIVVALKQQPLLQANATVGPTHFASCWRPASNTQPIIKWFDGDPTLGRGVTDEFQPIELENEIGFRFYGWQNLLQGEPKTEMRFVFQHACCDGKGAFDFVEDVLFQYQNLQTGNSDEAMRSFDDDRIVDRDKHASHSFNIVDRIWRTLIVRPKRAANMLLNSPLSLESRAKSNQQDVTDTPRQCSATLDIETTEKLGVCASSLGATTNLVLARELFHVLGDFLERSGVMANDSSDNLVRMLIPFSLRSETHQRMPAANCVSMAYFETKLDTLVHDTAKSPVLLADLVKQLAFIRRWKLQYSWIESIKSYARLWPLIRLFKRKSQKNNRFSGQQIATTVLTNLGRVFKSGVLPESDGVIKIGSLKIEAAHLVVPCNARQCVNFSVNFYCNRLTLDVSYLPSVVTREAAQQLLDSWQSRILAAIQKSS